jgi:hypothetical protein
MLASLAVKKSAAEAWKAVKSLWIGSEAVRNARTQRLRAEFESIQFKEGESVDDFTMCLGSLVAVLGTLGDEIRNNRCDRTTSEMRGLSSKIISGDSR